ncbi:MAG TPA: dienelactone hydrolase family protein [Luteimonas sp.]|nr:dienelactone hydrolase family protein [Luteimonas sp.]
MGTRTVIQVPGIGAVGGWLAEPDGPARGALVVIQEIFGVNAHMRAVAEQYAADGYLALAPALFDPVERDVELDYGQAGFEAGRALATSLGMERAVEVVAAAARVLCALLPAQHGAGDAPGAVGAVGFCWGGSVAFLANTRLGMPAVSYYGARTVPLLEEPLRAPMLFHFGSRDHGIPAADVEQHRQRKPDATVHVYAAGHGFNRDVDPEHYDAASARLAHARTLTFFEHALDADGEPGPAR